MIRFAFSIPHSAANFPPSALRFLLCIAGDSACSLSETFRQRLSVLALIFLIVFPFALWKAWKNIQLAKASTGWPTVSGTVTTSERAKVMFRKQPRVTYSYSVNGAPFTGQRISFAGGYPPGQTDAILSRYPVGQQVVVSHAPDNPAEAT